MSDTNKPASTRAVCGAATSASSERAAAIEAIREQVALWEIRAATMAVCGDAAGAASTRRCADEMRRALASPSSAPGPRATGESAEPPISELDELERRITWLRQHRSDALAAAGRDLTRLGSWVALNRLHEEARAALAASPSPTKPAKEDDHG